MTKTEQEQRFALQKEANAAMRHASYAEDWGLEGEYALTNERDLIEHIRKLVTLCVNLGLIHTPEMDE